MWYQLPLLRRNIEANCSTSGCSVEALPLPWGDAVPDLTAARLSECDLVVGADLVYDEAHLPCVPPHVPC